MSVIIDNVKFPASCARCKFLRIVEEKDMGATIRYYQCHITGEYFLERRAGFDFYRERSANCPLKPYPLEGSDK